MSMYPTLEECEEITPEQYLDLKDPVFKGQTRVDKDDMYWMCWESEGKLYKTHNKL